jgi:hypothetical protein
MTPILILRAALLPLNLWRLYQTRQVRIIVGFAAGGAFDQSPVSSFTRAR